MSYDANFQCLSNIHDGIITASLHFLHVTFAFDFAFPPFPLSDDFFCPEFYNQFFKQCLASFAVSTVDFHSSKFQGTIQLGLKNINSLDPYMNDN